MNMTPKTEETSERGSVRNGMSHGSNNVQLEKAQHGNSSSMTSSAIIVWKNVLLFALLHLSSLYALTLVPKAKWATLIWAVFVYVVGAVGVTAGAHRLWSHRAYKAKLPLKLLLICMNSTAFQVSTEIHLCGFFCEYACVRVSYNLPKKYHHHHHH